MPGHDQQAGDEIEFVRPDLDAEHVEAAIGEIDQHRLIGRIGTAVPADPRRDVIDRQGDDHDQPLQPAERAARPPWERPIAASRRAGCRPAKAQGCALAVAARGRCRRRDGPVGEILAAAQRMDIGRQHLDRHRIELAGPGGHDAGMGIGDAARDRRAAAAIKPDRVGQVRRAELARRPCLAGRGRRRSCRRRAPRRAPMPRPACSLPESVRT